MITRIYKKEELLLSDSHYGRKILCYANGYGMSYDFCRFYRTQSGTVLLNNSNCIADSVIDDELAEFIYMNCPSGIECSSPYAFLGYTPAERAFMMMNFSDCNFSENELTVNSNFRRIYEICSSAFGFDEFESWYADISHRVRHGMSVTFLYKNSSCTIADIFDGGYVYLSQTATAREMRGKGLCREIMSAVGNYFGKSCKKIYLIAYDDMVPFYTKLGFTETAKRDIYYERN